jgi:hypothetical protein
VLLSSLTVIVNTSSIGKLEVIFPESSLEVPAAIAAISSSFS